MKEFTEIEMILSFLLNEENYLVPSPGVLWKIQEQVRDKQQWRTPLTQHWGGRGSQISEFKVSLVYVVCFRTASTTQRELVANQTNKKIHLFYLCINIGIICRWVQVQPEPGRR